MLTVFLWLWMWTSDGLF